MTTSPFTRAPVRIELARERVVIPYASASRWIGAVCDSVSTSAALLPLLADTDRASLIGRMARGTVTADDTADAFYAALRSAVPGAPDQPVPWWESYRLLALSATPAAAGRALVAGLDPERLTPAAWCYAMYELMTQGLDSKGRFRFDASLRDPPAGAASVDDEWGDMTFDEMTAAARSTPGMR